MSQIYGKMSQIYGKCRRFMEIFGNLWKFMGIMLYRAIYRAIYRAHMAPYMAPLGTPLGTHVVPIPCTPCTHHLTMMPTLLTPVPDR